MTYSPEPVEVSVLYQPVTFQNAFIALEEAMLDLQEQIDDDDSIIEGKYFFRMGRCEPSKKKEDTFLEQGSSASK